MSATARPSVALLCATTLVLSVSGCATKKQTGELVGAVVGVGVGAAFGEGSGQVAAATVGFLVGSLVGEFIGERLDEADRHQAEQAAYKVASRPYAGRVDWTSNKNPGTHGYAEPLDSNAAPASGDISNRTFCFDPSLKVAYENARGSNCVRSDVKITEAEFNQRRDPGPSSTTYCFDPKINVAYQLSSGKSCVRADRQITEAEYRQAVSGTDRPSSPVVAQRSAVPTPKPSATPIPQPSESIACRRVREVVMIDGSESKTVTEYCLRAGQWTRA
jgi:surface antigen